VGIPFSKADRPQFTTRPPGGGQPVGQDFTTTRSPNGVWVSDLTYIPTGEGWLCRVDHKDQLLDLSKGSIGYRDRL